MLANHSRTKINGSLVASTQTANPNSAQTPLQKTNLHLNSPQNRAHKRGNELISIQMIQIN